MRRLLPPSDAHRCGSLQVAPSDSIRCALDASQGDGETQRRISLAAAVVIAEAVVDRRLVPAETLSIELAHDQISHTGQSVVAGADEEPSWIPTAPQQPRSAPHPDEVRSDGRAVAFELRRFMTGELSGMFDGLGANGLDLDVVALVLDFSAIYGSGALGPAVACLQMALDARLRARWGYQTISSSTKSNT